MNTPINKKISRISPFWSLGAMALFALLFFSCRETDDYYAKLKAEPELYMNKIYYQVYGIGDTLVLQGHFRGKDLRVKIGDADAQILSIQNITYGISGSANYPDTMQIVQLLIANNMGIGTNRPVDITVNGMTIQGPSLEIVSSTKTGLLPNGLTVQKLADIPQGSVAVFCRNQTGNVYLLDTLSYTLTRIHPDGRTETVFNHLPLLDAGGAAYHVDRLNGCGMDPGERYLYFSTLTLPVGNGRYSYYRLQRYDLQSGTLSLLNETPYHIWRTMRTLAAAQPFEGNIGEVKMFSATGIYPDSKGNVLFNMGGRLITLLDASGTLTYLAKDTSQFIGTGVGGGAGMLDPAPQFYNAATDDYFSYGDGLKLFPGTGFYASTIYDYLGLDAEKRYLYLYQQDAILQLYSLDEHKAFHSINNRMNASAGSVYMPYSVGSFNVLNYTGQNGMFGLLPLDSGQVLMLKYQDLVTAPTSPNLYPPYNMPTWAVVDFDKQWGFLYAPGSFDRKGHVMDYTSDMLLCRDASGMLYMTADNKQVILKTIYK